MKTSSISRPPPIAFICITIFLSALSNGIVFPILPALVARLTHGAPSQVATLMTVLIVTIAMVQFFAAPIHGQLADRFGRRPILLLANAGLAADFLLWAAAPRISWLFVGSIISASAAGVTTAAYAAVADVTTPQDRVRGYGLLGGAAGAGAVAGPLLGGVLGQIDLRLPFWTAAILCGCNVSYGLVVLRETLPENLKRSKFDWGTANAIGTVWWFTRRYRALRLILAGGFLILISLIGVRESLILYTSSRYGMSTYRSGLLFGILGLGEVLSQTVLLRPVISTFGARSTAIGGVALRVLGTAAMAFAPTEVWFWIGVPLICVGNVGGPPMIALANRPVSDSDQGRFAGVIASISNIAAMIGPALLLSLIGASTERPPRIPVDVPLMVPAVLSVIGIVLFARGTLDAGVADLAAVRDHS